MKHFVVFLAFIVLMVVCHAERPSRKCRSGLVKEEECILHCEYKYYGFTDDKFELDADQRGDFRNAMRKYGAIRIDQERQLDKHLKKCANEAKKAPVKSKSDKCRKIIQYYRCAVDNKLFQYNAYAKAIIALDKTINV
uniref:SP15-like salivary protein n=1 Tax=Phlebotomus orientalis TaxID=99786 RepID=V5K6C8_PHLOR|nr:SP15-like salivary protein [Phlebotomus orientalis]